MEKVEDYLVTEYHYAGENLERQLAKLAKYPDIFQEFADFIATRRFPDGVQSEGYNATQIQQIAPFMKPLGVYNFLIDLRDDPRSCKQIIKNGFPRL